MRTITVRKIPFLFDDYTKEGDLSKRPLRSLFSLKDGLTIYNKYLNKSQQTGYYAALRTKEQEINNEQIGNRPLETQFINFVRLEYTNTLYSPVALEKDNELSNLLYKDVFKLPSWEKAYEKWLDLNEDEMKEAISQVNGIQNPNLFDASHFIPAENLNTHSLSENSFIEFLQKQHEKVYDKVPLLLFQSSMTREHLYNIRPLHESLQIFEDYFTSQNLTVPSTTYVEQFLPWLHRENRELFFYLFSMQLLSKFLKQCLTRYLSESYIKEYHRK